MEGGIPWERGLLLLPLLVYRHRSRAPQHSENSSPKFMKRSGSLTAHPLSRAPSSLSVLCLPVWTNWTSGPLIRRKQMWTCPWAFSLLSGRFQGSLHTPATSFVSSKAFDLLMPIRERSKIKGIFLDQQDLCIFYAGTEMNMSHHRDQGQNASPWSELFLCQLCSGSVGQWCLKVCPAYIFADSAICVHGIMG